MRYHPRYDPTLFNAAFAHNDHKVKPPGCNSQARSLSHPLFRHPPTHLRCLYLQAQTFLLHSCSTLHRFVIRIHTMLRRISVSWLPVLGQPWDLSFCQVCSLWGRWKSWNRRRRAVLRVEGWQGFQDRMLEPGRRCGRWDGQMSNQSHLDSVSVKTHLTGVKQTCYAPSGSTIEISSPSSTDASPSVVAW